MRARELGRVDLGELNPHLPRLQVGGLIRATTAAMAERLQPSNCLAIWDLADALGLVPLAEHAKAAAAKDFEEVSRGDEFLELPHARLCLLLGESQLVVESENAVFRAMLAWVQRQGFVDHSQVHL